MTCFTTFYKLQNRPLRTENKVARLGPNALPYIRLFFRAKQWLLNVPIESIIALVVVQHWQLAVIFLLCELLE